MAVVNILKGLIGKEDLNIGSGTFARRTSTGATQTITRINADSLLGLGIFNVLDYGADRTGVESSAAAFQACADAAKAAGGAMYMPYGTYLIDDTVWLGKDAGGTTGDVERLYGDGHGTLIDGQCTGLPVFDFSGSHLTHISDFAIEGHSTNTPAIGMLFARTTAPTQGAALHEVEHVRCYGSYSTAAIYSMASEANTFIDVRAEVDGGGARAGYICVKSDRDSIASISKGTIAVGEGSITDNGYFRCQFENKQSALSGSSTASCIELDSCQGQRFYDTYVNTKPGTQSTSYDIPHFRLKNSDAQCRGIVLHGTTFHGLNSTSNHPCVIFDNSSNAGFVDCQITASYFTDIDDTATILGTENVTLLRCVMEAPAFDFSQTNADLRENTSLRIHDGGSLSINRKFQGDIHCGSTTSLTFTSEIDTFARIFYSDTGNIKAKGLNDLSQSLIRNVSSNEITVSRNFHRIQPLTGTTADLDTINVPTNAEDFLLTLRLQDPSDTITIKHDSGNIRLKGGIDYALEDRGQLIMFMYDSLLLKFVELTRGSALLDDDIPD